MRGAIKLQRHNNGKLTPLSCEPGEVPFQFPAKWWPDDSGRHIDVIAREACDGGMDIPWVVELKTKVHNRGRPTSEYRKAVTQVVLYREYLRNTHNLHFWFEKRNLDPMQFQAAVAFPKLEDARTNDEAGVFALSADFGVDVIELNVTKD